MKVFLRRHHALMVEDGGFSYKKAMSQLLVQESRRFLLNVWTWPIGGALLYIFTIEANSLINSLSIIRVGQN